MTLNTDVVIHGKPDRREVFDFCRAILGCPNSLFSEDEHSIANNPGQGFAAWLTVYGPEEQTRTVYGPDDDADDGREVSWEPPAFCRVNLDTTYGYQGPDGERCGVLHARIIRAIHAWCEARGLTITWQNEFRCTWHRGLDEIDGLGVGGEKATAWFRDVVLPAISRLGEVRQ